MPKKRSISHSLKKQKRPAFTRSEYIKKGLKAKVARFTSGFSSGNYTKELSFISLSEGLLPEQVLESLRISIGHQMAKMPKEGYILKIFPYPHEFTRKHGLLGITKAERLMKGMRHSFGKIKDTRAAGIKKGQVILKLWCSDLNLQIAKEALSIARKKFPFPVQVTIGEVTEIPHFKGKVVEEEKPIPRKQAPMKEGEKVPPIQEARKGRKGREEKA